MGQCTLAHRARRYYVEINSTLKQIADKLKSDLITLDGFMWFISKKILFYQRKMKARIKISSIV